jgi:chorismate mutase
MPPAMRLYALRGATSVTENDADAILAGTDALMREILSRNHLAAEDLVSCIFTLTEDLDAEFPAVAARKMGLSAVPLLCAREVPVPGALPHIIRVLIHCYGEDDHEPQHVYLGEAAALRLDLTGAQ